MLNKVFTHALLAAPLLASALDWHYEGEPNPGERVIFIKESHDNQSSQCGWITHYSSDRHKQLTNVLLWAPIDGCEKEVFDLGVALFYTP